MPKAKPVLLLKNASVPTDPYEGIFLENGFCPEFLPLLTHRHFDRERTLEYLRSSEFVDEIPVFIITSQRAVEMLGDCLSLLEQEVKKKILSKIGYTVGPATFSVLKTLGFSLIRGGERAGNGLKLAELIHEEVGDISTRMVFFTGVVRKDIIPRKLMEWNHNLQETVIYTTEVRDDVVKNFTNYIERTSGGWIVFFSPQGTELIVEYIRNQRQSQFKLASIGPTTEEYLLENSIKPDITASKPHASSLYEAIVNSENTA